MLLAIVCTIHILPGGEVEPQWLRHKNGRIKRDVAHLAG